MTTKPQRIQRLVLARVAEHRGWLIVQTYEDQGISGAKGRDQRPAFDALLKDAVRRRYDILMVWSIDRLGRSVLHVANALAELDATGIRLYCDQQGIDSSTPMGRAMIQMASVFGEQERSMLRSRVLAGLDRVRQQGKKLGRPKVSPKIENAIRSHLRAGNGILKVATLVGVGSGTVQRVKREMAGEFARGGVIVGQGWHARSVALHQCRRLAGRLDICPRERVGVHSVGRSVAGANLPVTYEEVAETHKRIVQRVPVP